MAGGGAALPIVGGFIGAMGAENSAANSSRASDFNAYVNNQNADLAIQQAAEEERKQRVYSSQVIGQSRANYGAAGVSSASGSALDVLQSSAANAELDALKIRNAGQIKAWGYKQGARLDAMKSSAASDAGNWGAANAIFGGVSQGIQAGAFD